MADEAAALPQAKGIYRGLAPRINHGENLLAPAPARDVVVLLAEPAACAQQRALDHRKRHSGAGGEFRIRESLQLAKHDDRMLPLGEPAERPVQGIELLALLEAAIWRRRHRDEMLTVATLDRNFPGPLNAPELVDAGVLRDLVDPGFERDRAIARAHPAEGRDEDVLSYVLRAAMVPDHSEHVREDATAIALVELPKSALIAVSRSIHQMRLRP